MESSLAMAEKLALLRIRNQRAFILSKYRFLFLLMLVAQLSFLFSCSSPNNTPGTSNKCKPKSIEEIPVKEEDARKLVARVGIKKISRQCLILPHQIPYLESWGTLSAMFGLQEQKTTGKAGTALLTGQESQTLKCLWRHKKLRMWLLANGDAQN